MIRWEQYDGARHLYEASRSPEPGMRVRALCGTSATVTADGLTGALPDDRDPLCPECVAAYRTERAVV